MLGPLERDCGLLDCRRACLSHYLPPGDPMDDGFIVRDPPMAWPIRLTTGSCPCPQSTLPTAIAMAALQGAAPKAFPPSSRCRGEPLPGTTTIVTITASAGRASISEPFFARSEHWARSVTPGGTG